MDNIELIALVGKVALVVAMLMSVAPVMNWVERRGAGWIQMRTGPNRVGPFGLFQTFADAIKFLWKEDPIPGHVSKFFYVVAPAVSLIPAMMTFAVIPFAGPMIIDGHKIIMQAADLNVGFLYIFAISSLGVGGIMMAGWASNNKFALLGALRSSSQMISYELSMGLSLIGLVMAAQSVQLGDIVQYQHATLIQLGPVALPRWGIFVQPIGFIIFLVSAFAETNRLPFDLPEGEPEIVGFHVEYGAMKFATFMMSEYMNMATASGLLTALFFGGYQLLPGFPQLLEYLAQGGMSGASIDWARWGLEIVSFSFKIAAFMWLFVWVRWTLPRFRYDQLMDLGWKTMLPLSLLNIALTAGLIYFGVL